MLQHNLRIAVRKFQRHKSSFFINLAGLSTALACTFLIFLWVQDEKQMDGFHKNDSRLFQVMERSKENGLIEVHDGTQGMLGDAMAKDLPEVEAATSVFSLSKEGIYLPFRYNEKAVKSTGIFASRNFFSTFSFPLIEGAPLSVLSEKNNVVISQTLAKNLFGSTQNAIGKTLDYEILGQKKSAMVSGVFANLPRNNSMNFDFVFTYELLLDEVVPNFKEWFNEGPSTYLVLKNGIDQQAFNNKIPDYIKRYFKETIFTLFVRPYSSAYLHGKYQDGVQAGGRIEYVRLFSLVAAFILLIACINFMNLSTAQATRSLKEVGIKKTLGSSRKTLVIQFMTEAMLVAFLSLIMAAVLAAILLPVFNGLTGKELGIILTPKLVISALGVTFVTGLLSGSYPAFYLSGFNPIAVLKGKLKTSTVELFARKGLVVFQFAISLVLIVAVLVIYQQVKYVQSRNIGYDKSNVIYFDKEGTAAKNSAAFLSELKALPGVLNASSVMQSMVQAKGTGASTYGIEWPGKPPTALIDFVVKAVDYNLIEMLGIKMKEGRSFSQNFGAENSKLIFNEAAVKVMGLKHPIGTPVKMWGKDMTIIGVVRDFHVSSLHDAIAPMVFRYDPDQTSTIMAKLAPGREKEALTAIESFYKKFNPGFVFQYQFLDQAYQAQYVAEQKISMLLRYFAGLAIIISCLGLFGLATFNAEVRTKEIGIRKVLGASVGQVMILLSKDFVRLVSIAMLIAFPLAWWAMNEWLGSFAYRVNISPLTFFIAGVAIIFITLLTVSYQSIRSALMNPSNSLRSE